MMAVLNDAQNRLGEKPLLTLLVMSLVLTGGCRKVGTAVSKYLPEKTRQVANREGASESHAPARDARLNDAHRTEDMGDDPAIDENFDPSADDFNEPEQEYGPETGEDFDPANEGGAELDFDPEDTPTSDPLADAGDDSLEDPEAFVDEFTGGSVEDPAGEPVGDPGLTPTGEAFPETDNGPGRSRGDQSGRSAQPGKRRGGKKTGAKSGSRAPTNVNPNNMRIEQPNGRPPMRLTANAAVPAMTREGQRIGFSVEYQLQFDGLSSSGEYGLVIESAKNGRFGTAVRLG